ncbi:DUF4124 domain-containing protein [Pelomonas sp. CA6]|uniref:DUF4124 domain-containing protein n=1 Tax=Pelomonas sp. CA6 TaxID=2907999 RepID=UPI001F4C49E1|nr:DUF4124 domain-containing protein [Pelomonas sp. CA6]MCH7345776.1 DUF4124 domain-containing protein [Pelomonas sp. CA6]
MTLQRTHRPSLRVLTPALLLVAMALAAGSAHAQAQWKWRDAQGRVQYSDRPPPPEVQDKDILVRPVSQPARVVVSPVGAATPKPASAPASSARPGEDLSSRDRVAQQEAAKQREEERKAAELRAENCRRAQAQLRMLEEGVRLARTNDKGEREILDDQQRVDETRRVKAVIAAECR